jgi:hypothetical protein
MLKTKGQQPASRVPEDTYNEILCVTPTQGVLLMFMCALFTSAVMNSDYIAFTGRMISE